MPRSKISEVIQAQVRQRAKHLCEFCHANERWQYVKFTIDHLIPVSLGGSSGFDNLALACFNCNRYKTNKLSAIDSLSETEVPLFNPRQDNWQNHFIWSMDKLEVVGLTATGRATVASLLLNRERVLQIRASDLEIGRHPPVDDPIE
jgi:5-methylcytosine-specific restriction endonuclease McrA